MEIANIDPRYEVREKIIRCIESGDKTIRMIVCETGAHESTIRHWISRWRYSGFAESIWKIENNKRVIYYRRCVNEKSSERET